VEERLCVCERVCGVNEWEIAYVCVCVKQRVGEILCLCYWKRQRDIVCVCLCVCVCVDEILCEGVWLKETE